MFNAPDRIRTCDLRFRRPGSGWSVRPSERFQFSFRTEVVSPESPERSRWKSESTLKQLIFISITVALALGIASCGAEEIAQVDAEYELEQRAQIDAAIADLEALKADPRRAQVASDAIDRYLFAKREVRRFNRAVGLDDAPPGSPTVIADDRFLDPARREVPSLGLTGRRSFLRTCAGSVVRCLTILPTRSDRWSPARLSC